MWWQQYIAGKNNECGWLIDLLFNYLPVYIQKIRHSFGGGVFFIYSQLLFFPDLICFCNAIQVKVDDINSCSKFSQMYVSVVYTRVGK